jgi:oligo-1,6-glucosidase
VLGEDRLLVVVNLSSAEHDPVFPDGFADRWREGLPLLTNTLPDAPGDFDAPLAPWEARVTAAR